MRNIIGLTALILVAFLAQNTEAQTLPLPTGDVTSLTPADGDIMCHHSYYGVEADASVTNNYGDKAIRALLVVQVFEKKPGNTWASVDIQNDMKLLDALETVDLNVEAGKRIADLKKLGNGKEFMAKVWLSWQNIGDDPNSTTAWHAIQEPEAPSVDSNGDIVDINTQHEFTIMRCHIDD